MTELQVDYFLALAQHRNFSRTAAVMHVSQAAVSKQISALEAELGLTLFLRRYRSLALTVAGEILLELLSRQRRELEEALREARARQSSDNLRLRVGLLEGVDMNEIYMELLAFRRRNPQYQVCVDIDSISALMDGLLNGGYDMAFSFHQEMRHRDYIYTRPALSARFQVFLSAGHPLGRKRDLRLADLAEAPFCAPIPDNEHVKREYCNRLYSVCGFMPRELICKPNLESVTAEVLYNGCAALLYDKTLIVKRDQFIILETESFNHISLMYARGNTNPLLHKIERQLSPRLLPPAP